MRFLLNNSSISTKEASSNRDKAKYDEIQDQIKFFTPELT